MPRLPSTGPRPEAPDLRRIFDDIRARGAEPPNLYQTLGNAPKMLRAWIDMAWPLRLDAETPRALRELMIMRGAQITGAAYEWVHHWKMAIDAGVAEAKLRALGQWRGSELFDARERAILAFTEEAMATGDVSDAIFAELAGHFDPAALVELVLTATFYVNVARVLKILRIEIEPGYEKYLDGFAS